MAFRFIERNDIFAACRNYAFTASRPTAARPAITQRANVMLSSSRNSFALVPSLPRRAMRSHRHRVDIYYIGRGAWNIYFWRPDADARVTSVLRSGIDHARSTIALIRGLEITENIIQWQYKRGISNYIRYFRGKLYIEYYGEQIYIRWSARARIRLCNRTRSYTSSTTSGNFYKFSLLIGKCLY